MCFLTEGEVVYWESVVTWGLQTAGNWGCSDRGLHYKVVWTVLNALRAHDDRFNAIINKIELKFIVIMTAILFCFRKDLIQNHITFVHAEKRFN